MNKKMYVYTEGGGVIQQPKIIKSIGDEKAIAQVILQTVDDVNRNRRTYPKSVMENGLRAVRPLINDRMFLGEMDHPSGDNEMRLTTVEYKSVSHLIREIEVRGNEVWGEIETLRVENGFKLYGLLKDKIKIGFSLRAMSDGDFGSVNGVLQVRDPLHIITWDCVSFPSHEKAVIQEVKLENATNLLENSYRNRMGTVNFEGRVFTNDIFEILVEKTADYYKNKYKKNDDGIFLI